MPSLTITFENGTSVVETSGFKGTACKDFTKNLEAALGTPVTMTAKPEFHAIAPQKQGQAQHLNAGPNH